MPSGLTAGTAARPRPGRGSTGDPARGTPRHRTAPSWVIAMARTERARKTASHTRTRNPFPACEAAREGLCVFFSRYEKCEARSLTARGTTGTATRLHPVLGQARLKLRALEGKMGTEATKGTATGKTSVVRRAPRGAELPSQPPPGQRQGRQPDTAHTRPQPVRAEPPFRLGTARSAAPGTPPPTGRAPPSLAASGRARTAAETIRSGSGAPRRPATLPRPGGKHPVRKKFPQCGGKRQRPEQRQQPLLRGAQRGAPARKTPRTLPYPAVITTL